MGPDAERAAALLAALRPAGSPAVRDRLRRRVPDLGPALAGRASALLLVLLGLVSLLHPVPRAVLGGAPGVAAVLAGSALLFVLVDPLGLLEAVETRVLASLLETLYPTTADAGGDPADVAAELHRLFPEVPWLDRVALRLTAWLLLVSPLLVLPSPRPFPFLSRERREEVARAWASTRVVPLRALFTLVKGTLSMLHFEREEVLEEIGWTPADSGYRED